MLDHSPQPQQMPLSSPSPPVSVLSLSSPCLAQGGLHACLTGSPCLAQGGLSVLASRGLFMLGSRRSLHACLKGDPLHQSCFCALLLNMLYLNMYVGPSGVPQCKLQLAGLTKG